MTAYRHELPGDLLKVLLDEQQISLISDFARLHEQRISQALEARAKDIKDDELDRLWEDLALNDQKWYNRFAVRWNSDLTKWRAAFTLQNLDALILAQWVEEGSEMHERFRNAIRLQDALKLGASYDELTESYRFEEPVDYARVYDTLCWVFVDALRENPSARSWPIARIMATATSFSRDALQALQNLGIIKIPDNGLDGLPGLDQTRGYANPSESATPGPLKAVYDWAWLMLSEQFVDDSAAPYLPGAAEGRADN